MWTKALATGIEKIDDQHRQLFYWFDELETAATDERIKATLYALTRLTGYSKAHFKAEEELMLACNYPYYAEHKSEHDRFCTTLHGLIERSKTMDISDMTVTFLRDWLVNHITTVDMEYVPYLD